MKTAEIKCAINELKSVDRRLNDFLLHLDGDSKTFDVLFDCSQSIDNSIDELERLLNS